MRGHGCRNGPSSRRRRPLFAGPPGVCWQLRRSAWRRARRRRARRRWLDGGGEGARELAGQLWGQPRNLACPSQGRTHVSAPHADSKSGREAELSDRVGGHGCCGRTVGSSRASSSASGPDVAVRSSMSMSSSWPGPMRSTSSSCASRRRRSRRTVNCATRMPTPISTRFTAAAV